MNRAAMAVFDLDGTLLTHGALTHKAIRMLKQADHSIASRIDLTLLVVFGINVLPTLRGFTVWDIAPVVSELRDAESFQDITDSLGGRLVVLDGDVDHIINIHQILIERVPKRLFCPKGILGDLIVVRLGDLVSQQGTIGIIELIKDDTPQLGIQHQLHATCRRRIWIFVDIFKILGTRTNAPHDNRAYYDLERFPKYIQSFHFILFTELHEVKNLCYV